MEANGSNIIHEHDEVEFDPINDIIDYLVRCVNISFKNSHVDESEVSTGDKIQAAHELYNRSPTEFLMQFGQHLAPNHIEYFEKSNNQSEAFRTYVKHLKEYHSETSRRKRSRNRRYNALQKLINETDYFGEKQMMHRNPLLYEQLVGQYLTDEEIKHRDGIDNENITFLKLILDTVDHNAMREKKNEQMLEEGTLEATRYTSEPVDDSNKLSPSSRKMWGDFENLDVKPEFGPEVRKQTMISAPERNLLREEFLQEMYSSFMEGRDVDFDYTAIDNNEEYDDLQQISQDAEDKYFDSETNEVDNLEEHMKLIQEYGRRNTSMTDNDDTLDVFMKHISNKLQK